MLFKAIQTKASTATMETFVSKNIFPGNKTVKTITASPQNISLKALVGTSHVNANAFLEFLKLFQSVHVMKLETRQKIFLVVVVTIAHGLTNNSLGFSMMLTM